MAIGNSVNTDRLKAVDKLIRPQNGSMTQREGAHSGVIFAAQGIIGPKLTNQLEATDRAQIPNTSSNIGIWRPIKICSASSLPDSDFDDQMSQIHSSRAGTTSVNMQDMNNFKFRDQMSNSNKVDTTPKSGRNVVIVNNLRKDLLSILR